VTLPTGDDGARPDWAGSDRQAIDDLATAFARREVLPHIDQWELDGQIPRSLHLAAGDYGILGLGFPEEAGGCGTTLDQFAVVESLIRAGVSTGVTASLFSHTIALPALVADGSEYLLDHYVRPTLAGELVPSLGVTEADAGSDVGGIRTRAVRDGDDYVVNGTKMYITSGVRADFVTMAVRTGKAGPRGISLLVVDKKSPGFEVAKRLDKMGWRCSDTAELVLVDVRVPLTNLVGEENTGFFQLMNQFQSERLFLAVECVATAQRCLALTIEWVKARQSFGAPLSTRQVVRHKIAEMARQCDVASTYVWSVARRLDAGEDVTSEVSMAKNTAVFAADSVVNEALQLHGGMGYMRECEVERHYRDIRVMGIGGGSNEIMNEIISKRLDL